MSVDSVGFGFFCVDAIPEFAATKLAAQVAADLKKKETEADLSTEKCTGGESNPYASRRWNLKPAGSATAEESREVTEALDDLGGPSDDLPPRSAAASGDPVEAALARALDAASAAGRFDIVGQLARELEARRVLREDGKVLQFRRRSTS